jgi:hypothetical protein
MDRDQLLERKTKYQRHNALAEEHTTLGFKEKLDYLSLLHTELVKRIEQGNLVIENPPYPVVRYIRFSRYEQEINEVSPLDQMVLLEIHSDGRLKDRVINGTVDDYEGESLFKTNEDGTFELGPDGQPLLNKGLVFDFHIDQKYNVPKGLPQEYSTIYPTVKQVPNALEKVLETLLEV